MKIAKDEFKYYLEIIRKANEILDKIGFPLIQDGYYSDDHYGDYYKYDKLYIERNRDNLYIKIENNVILIYNKVSKLIKYEYGNWPKLIETIYDEIPNILYEKEIEKEKNSKKIKRLMDLSDSFKFYISNYNKFDISQKINNDLLKHGITIKKEKRISYIMNTIQCYNMEEPYYVFCIYYQNNKVFEFNDNINNIFSLNSNNLENYVPDEWESIFKNTINQAKLTYYKMKQQQINNCTTEMINNFKKSR